MHFAIFYAAFFCFFFCLMSPLITCSWGCRFHVRYLIHSICFYLRCYCLISSDFTLNSPMNLFIEKSLLRHSPFVFKCKIITYEPKCFQLNEHIMNFRCALCDIFWRSYVSLAGDRIAARDVVVDLVPFGWHTRETIANDFQNV